VIIVEYYIRGSAEKHSRYFPTAIAARNFCVMLKSDPKCLAVNIIR
jgi:hypothetical protein